MVVLVILVVCLSAAVPYVTRFTSNKVAVEHGCKGRHIRLPPFDTPRDAQHVTTVADLASFLQS